MIGKRNEQLASGKLIWFSLVCLNIVAGVGFFGLQTWNPSPAAHNNTLKRLYPAKVGANLTEAGDFEFGDLSKWSRPKDLEAHIVPEPRLLSGQALRLHKTWKGSQEFSINFSSKAKRFNLEVACDKPGPVHFQVFARTAQALVPISLSEIDESKGNFPQGWKHLQGTLDVGQETEGLAIVVSGVGDLTLGYVVARWEA